MCCLFGIVNYGKTLKQSQIRQILNVLSREAEVRGTDATGIACNHNGKLLIEKRPLPAHKMKFHVPAHVHTIMGHTRMTTQGSEKHNCNNHPFRGQAGQDRFALAHNGMLYNDHRLRKEYDLPKTAIETDSYVAVQLIERYGELSFESLTDMAEKLDGSYTFTVLDERDSLYIVRGNNPMCLYHSPEYGLYLYASTEGILAQAVGKLTFSMGDYEKCPVAMGEILNIKPDGSREARGFSMGLRYSAVWEVSTSQKAYADELKSVAWMFGYTAEDVEALLEEGITGEEIEDYFLGLMEEGYY